ncbi:hypothetical protein ACFV03_39830, partial [Streptomyces mirabilis]
MFAVEVAVVVDANHDHLEDDATVMCLGWHGVGHSERDADTASTSPTPLTLRYVRSPGRRPGGVPLCLSSSEAWGSGFVEGAVAEHGEQHVDP